MTPTDPSRTEQVDAIDSDRSTMTRSTMPAAARICAVACSRPRWLRSPSRRPARPARRWPAAARTARPRWLPPAARRPPAMTSGGRTRTAGTDPAGGPDSPAGRPGRRAARQLRRAGRRRRLPDDADPARDCHQGQRLVHHGAQRGRVHPDLRDHRATPASARPGTASAASRTVPTSWSWRSRRAEGDRAARGRPGRARGGVSGTWRPAGWRPARAPLRRHARAAPTASDRLVRLGRVTCRSTDPLPRDGLRDGRGARARLPPRAQLLALVRRRGPGRGPLDRARLALHPVRRRRVPAGLPAALEAGEDRCSCCSPARCRSCRSSRSDEWWRTFAGSSDPAPAAPAPPA